MQIPDDVLQKLSTPPASAFRTDPTPQEAHLLAVAPHMAEELLRWRRAAQGRTPALSLALQWEAIEARLSKARRTLRSPDPIHPRDLKECCETLLRHSTDAAERNAAEDVLDQMQGAA